jgi:hypothetical protein
MTNLIIRSLRMRTRYRRMRTIIANHLLKTNNYNSSLIICAWTIVH